MILKRFYSQIPNLKKSVCISRSKNVYTNLALEDWMYKHKDFDQHQLLLLWVNDPCVVMGTFQNPWSETNPSTLQNAEVLLARRSSGGGTVYHENGNVNLSFFTSRQDHDRKKNLEFIQKVLREKYEIPVEISKTSDLLLNGCKVSGSASKFGSRTAYHHCSLLVDVNKILLGSVLEKTDKIVETTATKSVKSEVANLKEKNASVNVENLMIDLKDEFLTGDGKFQIVNPTEEFFPGLEDKVKELSSWKWLYGRTPKFSISGFVENLGDVSVMVEKGRISSITVRNNDKIGSSIFERLVGGKFDGNVFNILKGLVSKNAEHFLNVNL